jgi:hypothetical protein
VAYLENGPEINNEFLAPPTHNAWRVTVDCSAALDRDSEKLKALKTLKPPRDFRAIDEHVTGRELAEAVIIMEDALGGNKGTMPLLTPEFITQQGLTRIATLANVADTAAGAGADPLELTIGNPADVYHACVKAIKNAGSPLKETLRAVRRCVLASAEHSTKGFMTAAITATFASAVRAVRLSNVESQKAPGAAALVVDTILDALPRTVEEAARGILRLGHRHSYPAVTLTMLYNTVVQIVDQKITLGKREDLASFFPRDEREGRDTAAPRERRDARSQPRQAAPRESAGPAPHKRTTLEEREEPPAAKRSSDGAGRTGSAGTSSTDTDTSNTGCKFAAVNNCAMGDRCKWSHDPEKLKKRLASMSNKDIEYAKAATRKSTDAATPAHSKPAGPKGSHSPK